MDAPLVPAHLLILLLTFYIGLMKYRAYLKTGRPFVVRNVMDMIASMIYYHLPQRDLFPDPRKDRVPSELYSEDLNLSRYHIASLQQEVYGGEGFAIIEAPLIGYGKHRYTSCPACDDNFTISERDRLGYYYYNQRNCFSGYPVCFGCDATGFQGNFYLSSLTRDIPSINIPYRSMLCCENLDYSFNGKSIEFIPRENGFNCYNCVTGEGVRGQHFTLSKVPSSKCRNCKKVVINVGLVADCRVCHYSIFQNKTGLYDDGFIWVEE